MKPHTKDYIFKCIEVDRCYIFFCPSCKELHRHGYGEGHRGAHCTNPNSPFLESGYILKKYTTKELKELRIKTEYSSDP